jgi:hydroxymethylglutaryl-CoA reductase (NADPH)
MAVRVGPWGGAPLVRSVRQAPPGRDRPLFKVRGDSRERPWPHRNTPAAIEARRRALEELPGWRPEDRRILPVAGTETAAMAATQEAFTAQMVLPVAVVGPLTLTAGEYRADDRGGVREIDRRRERLLLPLAHTEGGLSVSVQRGILAANRDGGVRTYMVADGMTRDSLYEFDTVGEALRAADWARAHVAEMAAWLGAGDHLGLHAAEADGVRPLVSRHARLVGVRPHVIGTMLHLLFTYVTGEAAGPNMITRNTYALNQGFVLPRLRAELGLVPNRTILEANMGGDKKPSHLYHLDGGHGKTVVAEAALSHATLRHLLHVEAEDILALADAGLHGAHESGMQSFAFTPASVVAALFVVTGQDLGMVGTSSMAHIAARRIEPGTLPADVDPDDVAASRPYRTGGVHLSLKLSGVEVGTVGGGTVLPCAQTYLRLLGCLGPGSAYRLAQIVTAAAMALEISAGASMASPGSREFFRAHWKRGGVREGERSPDGVSAEP